MYRLRSLYALLDGFHELENQEIYFAPYDELNDPFEGILDMVWDGDSVVWENLFRHYLLCLDYKFMMAMLMNPDEFYKEGIPVMLCEMGINEHLQEMFQEIKDMFFSKESVGKLIRYLGERKLPVKTEELTFYLNCIHSYAFYCVLSIYLKKGLYQDNSVLSLFRDDEYLNSIIAVLENTPEDKEKLEIAYQYFNNITNQTALHVKAGDPDPDNSRVKITYFLLDFQNDYINHLKNLVYPTWYAACFMLGCRNTAHWAHYAEKHTGVALIFRAHEKNGTLTLPIERPTSYSAGKYHSNFVDMPFEKVEYSNTIFEVDFFRRMLNLTHPILEREWYTDSSGAKSICAEALKELDHSLRDEYWKFFHQRQNTKTLDWATEEEHRITLTSVMFDFESVESRKLKYKFEDLEGIIFGTRTPETAKIEIRRIIDEKCRQSKRSDFKFFQARFDLTKRELTFDELRLLH